MLRRRGCTLYCWLITSPELTGWFSASSHRKVGGGEASAWRASRHDHCGMLLVSRAGEEEAGYWWARQGERRQVTGGQGRGRERRLLVGRAGG